MLAFTDISPTLNKLYLKYKKRSAKFILNIKFNKKTTMVPAKSNLYDYVSKDEFCIITDGTFKLFSEKKLVRFYSTSDLVFPSSENKAFELKCEFGSRIIKINQLDFIKSFANDPDTISELFELMKIDDQINLEICSSLIRTKRKGGITLKEFNEGKIIIKEDTPPDEIYEMISGGATVIHNGIKVGEIVEGEIFGEISFLNNVARSATVVANQKCTVLVVKREEFEELVREKPDYILSIAKTMARRVLKLNDSVFDDRK